MYNIQTVEYYSAIEKNEILLFAATWVDLEGIISKISQKDSYHILLNMRNVKVQLSKYRLVIDTEKLVAARVEWDGKMSEINEGNWEVQTLW